MTDTSSVLARVRRVVAHAALAIDQSRDRINDLNVYPVPDGDTGTNLALSVGTVRSAVDGDAGATGVELARTIARAALMGARGNSGIILSQIVKGLTTSLGEAATLDSEAVARALRAASDAAYSAVRAPVEGTMLTVIRELAEAAEEARALPLDEALDRTLAAGEASLARTPELLQALADAGVVDAGGAGVVELLRGAIAGLRGTALRVPVGVPRAVPTSIHAAGHGESEFRYCTNFLVLASAVEPSSIEAGLEELGDCLIVVGDRDAIKVHLHTDDPGRALSIGTAAGGLAGVDVADMHVQIGDRADRLGLRHLSVVPEPVDHRACDVVAVILGDGNVALAREQGVRGVVVGGQSANPSIEELVRAIDACAADGVVLLPNNPNVQRAAEEAAASASLPCRVVASASIAVGLSLLVHYQPESSADRNAEAMAAGLEAIAYGEVTHAVRDARVDGLDVRSGQHVGLVGGRIVVAADRFDRAAAVVLQHLAEGDPGVVTIFLGAGFADREALDAALRDLEGRAIEVEVVEGGQPHYELLLAAE